MLRKEILLNKGRITVSLFLPALFVSIIVGLFPQIRDAIQGQLPSLPAAEQVQLAKILNFRVFLEQAYQDTILWVWIIAGILLGAGAIAKERETGAVEFMLSKPISRTKFLAVKFLLYATVLAIMTILTTLAAHGSSAAIGEAARIGKLALLTITTFSATLFIYSVAFLLSGLTKEQLKAIAGTAAFLACSWLLSLVDATSWLSLFSWAKSPQYWLTLPLMVGLSIAMFFVTVAAFSRQDLP